MIGASTEGCYVYFVSAGQLVPEAPSVVTQGLYLWHDGQIRYIGPAPNDSFQNELLSGGTDPVLTKRQPRVSPDGRHLLFSAESGVGLGGYDHGVCGLGCRELYLYSADANRLVCVSCDPGGVPARGSASMNA